jgi:hypothetical protein
MYMDERQRKVMITLGKELLNDFNKEVMSGIPDELKLNDDELIKLAQWIENIKKTVDELNRY